MNFDNLSPKQKALVDIAGALVAALIGSGIVAFIAYMGYWFEFAMALICYGMFGLIKMLYESRVFHYELQNKLNKKG
jgi:asparagine N-glycosylation enzyme membrane subunit Stt3